MVRDIKTSRAIIALAISLVLLPAAALAQADWYQMRQECINSGGTAASNYNDWVAQNGCQCGGVASGQRSCGAKSSSTPSAGSVGSFAGQGYTPQQQFILNSTQMLMPFLQQGVHDAIYGNPEEEARRKLEAERQAAAAAEQQRILEARREASKQHLLNSMKGVDDHELTIASLKDASLSDPEHLAAGHRVVDCEQTRKTYERMSAGLAAQKDALERTRAQIEGTKDAQRELSQEQRKFLIKSAYDVAGDLMASTDLLKARASAMKLDGLSVEQRREWLETMNQWRELHEKIDKGSDALSAGFSYGSDLPGLAKGIQANAARFNKFLGDSGMWEEGGAQALKYLGGPAPAAALKAGVMGIEFSYQMASGAINDSDLAQAQSTYDALHAQLSSAEETISNARSDLADYCGTSPLNQARGGGPVLSGLQLK